MGQRKPEEAFLRRMKRYAWVNRCDDDSVVVMVLEWLHSRRRCERFRDVGRVNSRVLMQTMS